MTFKILSLDVETYSPKGFPYAREDPIIIATLMATNHLDIGEGAVILSLLYPPNREKILLKLLKRALTVLGSKESYLITYNGASFDLPYITLRGRLYGIDFENIFTSFTHIDVYHIAKSMMNVNSYTLKSVESELKIPRNIKSVDGSTIYEAFHNLKYTGDLRVILYNIEDTVNSINILNKLRKIISLKQILPYF
ncbi:MAG: ribonuclease H-like domain-containing protein [Nitrososphaerota archaeon]|nr:ribonuclease H-like domain-containing protein [Nitrososphaerota archaeon]